jgi:hypothetical protein
LKTSHSEGILLKLDFEKAYDRVQWPFLAEVMHRKNFPDRWIDAVGGFSTRVFMGIVLMRAI